MKFGLLSKNLKFGSLKPVVWGGGGSGVQYDKHQVYEIEDILFYFSMNYRVFSVKSKLIISLFQTVKLSISISLFQKTEFL